HRAVADELRTRLVARMVEAGEPQPVIEAAPTAPASSQRRVDPQVHTSGLKPTRLGHQPPPRRSVARCGGPGSQCAPTITQEACDTEDMLKSGTRRVGIAVRGK